MTELKRDNPYGLIALDIDGTLINKKGEVLEKTKKAIQEILERGIKVTLATGRIWTSVEYLVKTLGLREPIILHNGALIRDIVRNTILCSFSIENPLKERLVLHLKEAGLDYLFCSVDGNSEHILYYQDPEHIWAQSFLKGYKDIVIQLEDFSLENCSLLRALVFGERKRVEALKRELEGEGLKALFFHGPTETGFMEVFQEGCSKAQSLEYLAERMGFKPEKIMAFGDDINDLEMIRYAGCGVAMGTAPAILLEEADYVTLSAEEEGVGDALEKLVLQEGR